MKNLNRCENSKNSGLNKDFENENCDSSALHSYNIFSR